MSIDNNLKIFKDRIGVLLSEQIGNFIFPDGNQDKALITIPDKVLGSNYPLPGTTLQEDKIGVVLRLATDQQLRVLLDLTDIKIKVSVFTNKDANLLYHVWSIIEQSELPIIGNVELKSATIDPEVKHFLIFHLLTTL